MGSKTHALRQPPKGGRGSACRPERLGISHSGETFQPLKMELWGHGPRNGRLRYEERLSHYALRTLGSISFFVLCSLVVGENDTYRDAVVASMYGYA